jgi:Holliday junction resolvase RusA-like endonuclease
MREQYRRHLRRLPAGCAGGGAVSGTFRCTIPGDPRGKGSVRVSRWGAYKDEATDTYMGVVMTFCRTAMAASGQREPMTGPLAVEIDAWLRRPDRLIPRVGPRIRKAQPPSEAFPACAKPDADNVAKLILDALTQAGVIADDKAVWSLSVKKRWVAVGGEVGVDVRVDAG